MLYTDLVNKLINALRCLPGVGPRSAQRMAFHLLEHGRESGTNLAAVLNQALTEIGRCRRCRTFSETEFCSLCLNPRRDSSILCIVETPADVIALEQTNSYRGFYFVLMGHLSPIDGIGPDEIGVTELVQLLDRETIAEVILATNPTVEGEATAHYLAEIIKNRKIKCTRIAHGIPVGGELEYLDSNTLTRAMNGRLEVLD